MRILALTKRIYTRRDVLNDRYGRIYEFVAGLARSGHGVRVICVEYGSATAIHPRPEEPAELEWITRATGPLILPGWLRLHEQTIALARAFSPDIVLSMSDAFHVARGDRVAGALDLPHVVDLYDNFEAFLATSIPGTRKRYRTALRRADAVSVVSDPLRGLIERARSPARQVAVVTNGVDNEIFQPSPRATARTQLGLPNESWLIGTAGALDASRGISDLLQAFEEVQYHYPEARLVLAGRMGRVRLPQSDRVIYLGDLPQRNVATLFNALDVGVVCNRPSSFGTYCFPQKSVEMAACRLPLVMANVGVAASLAKSWGCRLYNAGNPADLAQKLLDSRDTHRRPAPNKLAWKNKVGQLEELLAGAC